MRIPRVFTEAAPVVGEEILLDRAQARYLSKVLRLKPGAAFLLFNGRDAVDYRARLLLDGKHAAARIESSAPLATESKLASRVIQGMGRADHADWTIQKTTELGVRSISIFNAARTQSPLKQAQHEKRIAHWRGVASSACEQCGRAVLPHIEFHHSLEQALNASNDSLKLLLDFAGEPLAGVLPETAPSVSILLGPEGGLDDREVGLAHAFAYRPVSLGARVLRTETAALAALAIVQSALGDLS